MKVLIVSDVHGDMKLLERILEDNNDVDLKIYLGDFQVDETSQKAWSVLFDYIVTGNTDVYNISEDTIIAEIEGERVFITHGHLFGSNVEKINFDLLYSTAAMNNCKFILHGHDHISVIEERGGIVRFNPGSTTQPRNTESGTYGILEISNSGWNFEHIKC